VCSHQQVIDCDIDRNGRVYLKEFVWLLDGLVWLVQYCSSHPQFVDESVKGKVVELVSVVKKVSMTER
jgi:hypothetical protein